MGNRTPQEFTPYVFNWKYDGATLKTRYLQAAAAGAKDWLREAHKSDEFVVESLCSAFMVIGEFEPRQGRCRFGNQSRVVSSSVG